MDDNIDVESDEFLIDCGIVSVLLAYNNVLSEVSEVEDDFLDNDEVANEKPLSYHVMGNGEI